MVQKLFSEPSLSSALVFHFPNVLALPTQPLPSCSAILRALLFCHKFSMLLKTCFDQTIPASCLIALWPVLCHEGDHLVEQRYSSLIMSYCTISSMTYLHSRSCPQGCTPEKSIMMRRLSTIPKKSSFFSCKNVLQLSSDLLNRKLSPPPKLSINPNYKATFANWPASTQEIQGFARSEEGPDLGRKRGKAWCQWAVSRTTLSSVEAASHVSLVAWSFILQPM